MKPKQLLLLSLKILGITALLIVSINLISAAFSIVQLNGNLESFHFKHGLFKINGEPVGMNFVEAKYWLFYAALFILCFTFFFKKRIKNE